MRSRVETGGGGRTYLASFQACTALSMAMFFRRWTSEACLVHVGHVALMGRAERMHYGMSRLLARLGRGRDAHQGAEGVCAGEGDGCVVKVSADVAAEGVVEGAEAGCGGGGGKVARV